MYDKSVHIIHVATIIHVLNFNAATIQGWPLIEGGVYCTETPSVWRLFKQVKTTMHVSVLNKLRSFKS